MPYEGIELVLDYFTHNFLPSLRTGEAPMIVEFPHYPVQNVLPWRYLYFQYVRELFGWQLPYQHAPTPLPFLPKFSHCRVVVCVTIGGELC